jgi:ribose transport system substrate-binding protein
MSRRHSRREFVKRAGLASVVATAGLAGCTGGDGGSGSGGSSGGSDSGGDGAEDTESGGTQTTSMSESGSGGSDTYDIGFQVGGLGNSWFTALATAGRWYGESNGMNVNIGDGELNPTTQVNVARSLINSGIDALIVNPFDSDAMATPVEAAADKDIPVFSVDSVATSPELKQYTAFGNFSAGKRAAENAVAELERTKGAKEGTLCEVMIEQSAKLGVARHEGTVAGIEQYSDVDIVGEIVTDNTRQDTSTKVFNFLQQNPDVDGFVCHAVTTGNGTLNALERHDMKVASGNEGHKVLSQIDAGPTTLTAINEGFVDVAIDQPVHFYAPITMHYIKQYLDSDKDDSVLPSVGSTVEADAFTLKSETAMQQAGQDIWAENVWAPAQVEQTEAVDDVPWFHTNSIRVTSENADAPYLWGNWIKKVA